MATAHVMEGPVLSRAHPQSSSQPLRPGVPVSLPTRRGRQQAPGKADPAGKLPYAAPQQQLQP